ncbi:MAG: MMPL family transporter, partial [Acidimicrobiia bacterium]
MLARLARFAIRRKRQVALGALLFVVLAGALGGNVAQHLSNGGFQDSAAESSRAKDELATRFGTGVTNLVVLVRAKTGTVDDPAVVAAATSLVQRLTAEPGVTSVASYWTLGNAPPLKNNKGDKALVLGTITGSEDAVRDRIEELGPAYRTDGAVIASEITGQAEIFRQVGATIESDLKKAEMIALPITLVLLVLIFGSVVAASLPLAIGILSVMGTFLVLRTLAAFTEVSIFSLNLTTAMGLGLAIDYSLFVVSRHREELRAGHAPNEAIVRTVRTAGRTVAFSAATVGISLAALLVFPLSFLRSFAYAGIAVAVMTALGAVVVLPALLALLGRRVNALKVRNVDHADTGIGIWHRVAMAVMRRPIGVATAVITVLLVLGGPFLHLDLGLSDYRVLPSGASSRTTQETIVAEFGSLEAGATEVVLANTASSDVARVA